MMEERNEEQYQLPTVVEARDAEGQRLNIAAGILEKVAVLGDLSQLSPAERMYYYKSVCESLGVNPLTKPFDYLELGDGDNKKLKLYPNEACAAQLRDLKGITIESRESEIVEGVYIVRVKGKDKTGRSDEAIGAVPLVEEGGEWKEGRRANGSTYRFFEKSGTEKPLGPLARANAMKKAETQAKRRLALSLGGLGYNLTGVVLDLEDIPEAATVPPQVVVDKPKQLTTVAKKGFFTLATDHQISEKELREYMRARFETDSPQKLTEDQREALKLEIEDGTVRRYLAVATAKGEGHEHDTGPADVD